MVRAELEDRPRGEREQADGADAADGQTERASHGGLRCEPFDAADRSGRAGEGRARARRARRPRPGADGPAGIASPRPACRPRYPRPPGADTVASGAVAAPETMEQDVYRPKNAVRFVTAASLFDGHDAAINVIRRILQDSGAEVIHLGHNRSVLEIVQTAVDEDAQGIAISSYQGGHLEFFKYAKDLLREMGAEHVKVFGGGGGVIVPA